MTYIIIIIIINIIIIIIIIITIIIIIIIIINQVPLLARRVPSAGAHLCAGPAAVLHAARQGGLLPARGARVRHRALRGVLRGSGRALVAVAVRVRVRGWGRPADAMYVMMRCDVMRCMCDKWDGMYVMGCM
jgi:hypothetical protein